MVNTTNGIRTCTYRYFIVVSSNGHQRWPARSLLVSAPWKVGRADLDDGQAGHDQFMALTIQLFENNHYR